MVCEQHCLQAPFPDINKPPRMEEADPLLACKPSVNPNAMCQHQVVRDPDRDKVVNTVVKEPLNQHSDEGFEMAL